MAAPKSAPLAVVDGTRRGKPRKASPGSVKAAADGGNQRELLVALRSRIAEAIDEPGTPLAPLAALVMRLLAITKDIESLDVAGRVDPVGDAAATPDAAWPAT